MRTKTQHHHRRSGEPHMQDLEMEDRRPYERPAEADNEARRPRRGGRRSRRSTMDGRDMGDMGGRGGHRRRHGGPPWEGRRRMRRGDIRTALLAALAEGPGHGYDVMQTLEDKTGGAWRP